MDLRQTFSSFVMILFAFVLCSCCSSVSRLDIDYKPDAGKKSPLSSITPLSVTLQVEDRRPSDTRDIIGYTWHPYCKDSRGGTIQSEKPVPDILYDALSKELVQNNHKVLLVRINEQDVTVTVSIEKFWLNFRVFSRETSLVGQINANINIIRPDRNSLSKTINTTHQIPFNWNVKSTYQKALLGTIAEFVKDFAYDTDILEALKKLK